MHKNTKLVFLFTLLLLFIVGAYGLYQTLAPQSTQQQFNAQAQSQAATNFTVYDEAGQAVQLSDFQGKPVVLNFWASWCGPCRSEMPHFDALSQKLEGKVHFLMVNVTDGQREDVAKAAAFIKKQGYSFPVYFDKNLQAAAAYNIYALPTTYFIDAQGKIVSQASGALTAGALQTGVNMIYQP